MSRLTPRVESTFSPLIYEQHEIIIEGDVSEGDEILINANVLEGGGTELLEGETEERSGGMTADADDGRLPERARIVMDDMLRGRLGSREDLCAVIDASSSREYIDVETFHGLDDT